MGTERKSLIRFVLGAFILTLAIIWFGNWITSGGASRAKLSPGQIVFISDRYGSNDLWVMNSDGSNSRRIAAIPGDERETAVSPDGTKIYFTSNYGQDDFLLSKVRPNGRSQGRMVTTSGSQTSISVSRSTGAVAYVSNSRVFACEPDGAHPKVVMPTEADLQVPQNPEDPDMTEHPRLRRFSKAQISPSGKYFAAASVGYQVQRVFLSLGQDKLTVTLLDPFGKKMSSEEVTFCWGQDSEELIVAASGPPGATYLAVYKPADHNPESGSEMAPSAVLILDKENSFGIRNPSANAELVVYERVKYGKDSSRTSEGIWSVPRSGGRQALIVPNPAVKPLFSPDGKLLLFQSDADLCTWKNGTVTNLTKGQGINRFPSWSLLK